MTKDLPSSARILLVTEASGGGVGRHVLDLAEGLSRRGHRITIVYSPRREDPSFARRRERLSEVRFEALSMRRAPHPGDRAVRRKLEGFVGQHGPFDVVHAQSTKAGIVVRQGKRLAKRVVYTPHCVYSMNPRAGLAGRVMTLWERWLMRSTDQLIAVSPDEREHLLERGFDPAAVRYVPNGIDCRATPERTATRQALGWPESWQVVGFLGRFQPQKNPELLLRAFALIAARLGTARLAMVGSGPREDKLRKLAGTLGIGGQVLWMGHRQAFEVMPAFDLFALPSLYESFPYVLLEALVCALPIVASPVGGTGQVLSHGENGFVVKPVSPEAFSHACLELLESREMRLRFGARSRARASEYDLETMVSRTLDVYRGGPTKKLPSSVVQVGKASC